MNKQLIIDCRYFDISPSVITEAINPNGPIRVEGILQTADTDNQNGRTYPRHILEREIEKYTQLIKERRALGELDHPNSSVIELKNVSHNIVDIRWDGNDVVGVVEILTTPSGNILRELIKCGIKLGISSRGMGTVKEDRNGKVVVGEDFSLVGWDFVSSPSNRGSFMKPTSTLNESVEPQPMTKYCRAEALIRDILTEIAN